jgi:DNA-binding Lrp family transcriptional regulator
VADLDAVDSALLALLQNDARRTNRELAESLGIAPSTCLERVRSLRRRGLIVGYHAQVDLAGLGAPVAGAHRGASPTAQPRGDRWIQGVR